MPKVSLDIPSQLLDDLKTHVGDEKKFVSVADAVRTACRKLLDQLDAIDDLHGRSFVFARGFAVSRRGAGKGGKGRAGQPNNGGAIGK